MQQYLLDLIDRMNNKSDLIIQPGFDSTKTISWKATREAEKLDKKEYIPLLKTIIENEKDKNKRDKAYFILGHIALNLSDETTAAFLIQRIPKETDKYVLSSMLLNLMPLSKPKGTDLSPLLDLLSHEQWQVRQAAIQALNHHQDEKAEEQLIKIIDTSEEHYDILYALAVLRDAGTTRALPAVQKHANSNKKDIKSLAAAAITAIKQRKK
jgi:HEAT repeat protein